MANLTRRTFAFAAASVTGLLAQDKSREITSASVPDDPAAPRVSDGTLPERLPFDSQIDFTRKDVTPKLLSFPLTSVRLLPGTFSAAHDANRKFILDQSPDRLLHVFRVKRRPPIQRRSFGRLGEA